MGYILSEHISLDEIALTELKKLVSLIKRIYPPAYKHLWKNEDCNWYINKFYSEAAFKKDIEEQNTDYCFIKYDSKIVGIVRVVYHKTFPDKKDKSSAYINRIYLAKEAQGKGIANTIFNWIEKRAKQHNNKILWLKVMDTQEQALKFYKKQNFSISSTTGLDFELLHKPLRGMYVMYKEL